MLRWFRKKPVVPDTPPAPRRRRRRVEVDAEPAHLPDGQLVYAIGDIHGRADLLEQLLDRITVDAAGHAGPASLILLGDYVDRGEQSREVIDLCLDRVSTWPGEVVFLKGNHEDALLSFLDNPADGDAWLGYGGLATLMSYGVGAVREHMPPEELTRAGEDFAAALPAAHLKFLADLQLSHRIGDYFFCHAGMDPLTVPERQVPHVLMWGTGQEDLDMSAQPLTVIHGHYVHSEPVQQPKRISIDTGAYFSGRLTAVKLAPGEISFLGT